MSAIVESDGAWETLFAGIKKEIPVLAAFDGKLADKAELLKCLKRRDECMLKVERLYVYARMKKDQDVKDGKYKGLEDRAGTLSNDFSAAVSYIAPQLSALSKEQLETLIKDKDFADYDYYFSEILREKEHILGDEAEKILAMAGDFAGGFQDIFGMIDNAEVPFKKVDDGNGQKVKLTHGLYSVLLQNPDAKIRAGAFRANYNAYKSLINTIASTYAGSVKKDAFYTKARKYKSSVEAALQSDDIPEKVYRNLIDAVHENLKPVHEYVKYRADVLACHGDTLPDPSCHETCPRDPRPRDRKPRIHMYDMYVPLVENADIKLPYEEAYALVKEGLKPLGAEYQTLLDKAYTGGWIDVYETENKRSGAYSWGAYGSHPYVLLNYQQTTHDVFTIAHELGHAMHSYYSDKNQSYAKAGYRIFVAEVASTVNEVLLLKHLLKNAPGNAEQSLPVRQHKYLLTYYLDMFRTTLFRQTMFAEFEMLSHGMAERGEPLTEETLSDAYYKLNKKYYGKSVIHDRLIRYEWAWIPHFYNSFYVYKYATGLTSAVCIAEDILKNGAPAVERYMKFLKAGGHKSAYEILKDAGADLQNPAVYAAAMQSFSDALRELKKL